MQLRRYLFLGAFTCTTYAQDLEPPEFNATDALIKKGVDVWPLLNNGPQTSPNENPCALAACYIPWFSIAMTNCMTVRIPEQRV
jgi:hypothetical protein